MKTRKINAAAFKAQLEEHVIGDGKVLVELNDNPKDSITMRLTVLLDDDIEADRAILDQLRDADNDVDKTLDIILDVDGQKPADAIERARKAGITKSDLFVLWGYEQREAQEQLGNFRFRASKS